MTAPRLSNKTTELGKVETELKECGAKRMKEASIFFCLAYFLVVLLIISFSFVRTVTALVPWCLVCVFSVADHNGDAKPRMKLWGVEWERERERKPLRCLLGWQVTD